jgi:hypothetical protein
VGSQVETWPVGLRGGRPKTAMVGVGFRDLTGTKPEGLEVSTLAPDCGGKDLHAVAFLEWERATAHSVFEGRVGLGNQSRELVVQEGPGSRGKSSMVE